MSGLEPVRLKDGGFPDLTGDGKVTQADILKGRGVPGLANGGDPRFMSREGFFSMRDDPERLNVRDITDFIFDPSDPLDYAAAGMAATGVGLPAAAAMKTANTGRKVLRGIGTTLGATPLVREGIEFASNPIEYGKGIIELVASAPDAGGVISEIASSLAQYPEETVELIYETTRETAGYPVERAEGGIMQYANGTGDMGVLPASAKTPTGKKKKAVMTVMDMMDEIAEKLPTKTKKKTKKEKEPSAEDRKIIEDAAKQREAEVIAQQARLERARINRANEPTVPQPIRSEASQPIRPQAPVRTDAPEVGPPRPAPSQGANINKAADDSFKGTGTGAPGRAQRLLEGSGRFLSKGGKFLGNLGLYGLAGYGGMEIGKRMLGSDDKENNVTTIPEPDGSTIANVSTGSNTNALLPENDPSQQDPNTLPKPGTTTTTTKTSSSTKTVGSGSPTPSPAPAPSPSGDEDDAFDPKDIASSDRFAEIMKYNLITDKGFNVDDKGNFVGQKPTFIDYLKTLPSTYMDKVGRDEDYAKKMMAGFLNMMRPVEGYVPVNPAVAFGDAYLAEETRQAEMESAMAKTLRFLDKNPEQKAAYMQTLRASSGIDPYKDIDPKKNREAFDDLFLNMVQNYRITTDSQASADDFYLYDPVEGEPFTSTSLLSYQNSNPALVPVVVSRLQLVKRNPG